MQRSRRTRPTAATFVAEYTEMISQHTLRLEGFYQARSTVRTTSERNVTKMGETLGTRACQGVYCGGVTCAGAELA